MTTKTELHRLIDVLPDSLADEAARRLQELQLDDEPETGEEHSAAAEARAELARGEGLTTAQLRHSLGL